MKRKYKILIVILSVLVIVISGIIINRSIYLSGFRKTQGYVKEDAKFELILDTFHNLDDNKFYYNGKVQGVIHKSGNTYASITPEILELEHPGYKKISSSDNFINLHGFTDLNLSLLVYELSFTNSIRTVVKSGQEGYYNINTLDNTKVSLRIVRKDNNEYNEVIYKSSDDQSPLSFTLYLKDNEEIYIEVLDDESTVKENEAYFQIVRLNNYDESQDNQNNHIHKFTHTNDHTISYHNLKCDCNEELSAKHVVVDDKLSQSQGFEFYCVACDEQLFNDYDMSNYFYNYISYINNSCYVKLYSGFETSDTIYSGGNSDLTTNIDLPLLFLESKYDLRAKITEEDDKVILEYSLGNKDDIQVYKYTFEKDILVNIEKSYYKNNGQRIRFEYKFINEFDDSFVSRIMHYTNMDDEDNQMVTARLEIDDFKNKYNQLFDLLYK